MARSPGDRRRFRRRMAGAAFVLTAAAGLTLVLVLGGAGVEVEVAPTTRGTYVREVQEDGRARIRDRYVVSAPLAGTLERLRLRVGDHVAAHDVITVLHPAPAPLLDSRSRAELREAVGAAEARLASTRASRARADATREQARSDLARARLLSRSGTIAARALEEAQLGLTIATRERDAARHATHLAEHELRQAQMALTAATESNPGRPEGFELRAPAEGRVLHVRQESEAVVPPGTPIVELGDPSALEVVVDLLSTDAVLVDAGAEAEILGWGGGTSLRARVRTIQPIASVRLSALGVEEERVDVVLDPVETTERWSRVGDGYRVDVRIPVERFDGVLRIPTSALFRAGDEWHVFVARESVANEVAVGVRSYGPLVSVVGEGLNEGDLVVLQPPESLRDGARISVRDAP